MKTAVTAKVLPDYTEGSILKSLISLSIPIVFANVLHSAYQLVDTFWVGRLGKEAVASVSLSFPIIFLMLALGGGLAMSGTILVAQYKGRGDLKMVNKIATQTLLILLISSVIISIIGYFISEPIMNAMGAEAGVIDSAVSYLKISFIGTVFLFGFFVFQALLRGVGEVKMPLYLVFGTVLLNLILDPLFIMGYGPIPAYGVSGAALATIGTQGLAAIIGIAYLFTGKYGIKIKLKYAGIDKNIIKKMLTLGLPASMEQSARALGLITLGFLVASLGTLTVASYGIGSRILSFVIIPVIGISMATSTLVGQNIGAGKIGRAEETAKLSAIISFVIVNIVGVLLFIFAKETIAVFIPNDTETIISGTFYLRIMALSFGFMALQHTFQGVFMGSGNVFTSMFLSFTSLWLILLPLAYYLSKHTYLKETGVWIAFPISHVVGCALAVCLFYSGRWKEKRLIFSDDEKIQDLQGAVVKEVEIENG